MFKSLLYIVAAILGTAWAIGYFALGISGIVHILPVLAVTAISLQWIFRRKLGRLPNGHRGPIQRLPEHASC